MSKQREREIIVTPEELTLGYLEKIGPDVYDRSFQVVRRLPSGDYLVVNPMQPKPEPIATGKKPKKRTRRPIRHRQIEKRSFVVHISISTALAVCFAAAVTFGIIYLAAGSK